MFSFLALRLRLPQAFGRVELISSSPDASDESPLFHRAWRPPFTILFMAKVGIPRSFVVHAAHPAFGCQIAQSAFVLMAGE